MRQIVWIYHRLEGYALNVSITDFGSERTLMESEFSCVMRRACSIRAETKIEIRARMEPAKILASFSA